MDEKKCTPFSVTQIWCFPSVLCPWCCQHCEWGTFGERANSSSGRSKGLLQRKDIIMVSFHRFPEQAMPFSIRSQEVEMVHMNG